MRVRLVMCDARVENTRGGSLVGAHDLYLRARGFALFVEDSCAGQCFFSPRGILRGNLRSRGLMKLFSVAD